MSGEIRLKDTIRFYKLFLSLALVYCTWQNAALADTPLTTQTIGNVSLPVFITHAKGDASRLFIVEKAGRIRIFKNGTLLPEAFLNITSRVLSSGSEQGLLGMAFHPNYAANGLFYVNYTAQPNGRTVVSEFLVTSNPDSADSASERILLQVAQFAPNHNGGMMAFSPLDDYLYIGMGDGGGSNDAGNRAQNGDSLLGKMLRVDVDTASSYAIPPSNPFVIPDSARHEIWAFGLRNPWRWSFDRLTGDMWIADVGQNLREELDYQPGSSLGGENYGWRLKEGLSCFIPSQNCDPGSVLTDPITQYEHAGGRCSVTGGYVYRGCAIPDLFGTYFYGDYCTGEIWSFRYDGATISDSMARPELSRPNFSLVSFGEDAEGELYMAELGSGRITKIVPNGVPAVPCTSCCIDTTGNVDYSADQLVDIADLTVLIEYLFVTFEPLPCPAEANTDGDVSHQVDIADLTALIDHLFISTLPLPPCL